MIGRFVERVKIMNIEYSQGPRNEWSGDVRQAIKKTADWRDNSHLARDRGSVDRWTIVEHGIHSEVVVYQRNTWIWER